MTTESVASIEILGKMYHIKCSEHQISSLHTAATYLNERMRALQETGKTLSIDRLAVMTALNITHEFLHSDTHQLHALQKKLTDLYVTLENALEQDNKDVSPAK